MLDSSRSPLQVHPMVTVHPSTVSAGVDHIRAFGSPVVGHPRMLLKGWQTLNFVGNLTVAYTPCFGARDTLYFTTPAWNGSKKEGRDCLHSMVIHAWHACENYCIATLLSNLLNESRFILYYPFYMAFYTM